MTLETSIAQRYLAPHGSAFWEWRDGGKVIAWCGGATIAFAAELEAVLDRLAPRGLPPMDALVLLLAACRANSPDAGWPEHTLAADSGFEHSLKELQAAIGLLPRDLYAKPARKAELAAMMFEDSEPTETAVSAAIILAEFRRGILREVGDDATSGHERHRIAALRALEAGTIRIDAARLALKQKTGLEQLPRPGRLDAPPADSIATLLKSLERDEELGGVARLARNLTAALTLPRAVSQPQELPVGGVSDITNRGPLDRLLLSELAQDDLTFTVRVALNEALYLRRETPPGVPPQRRMILVDAGLRMWGLPRVFACAAAMALGVTRRSHDELAIYRPRDVHLDYVDLHTREGLVAHLAALEPSAHPGAALPTFRRLILDDESAGEAVVITSEDVWADKSFRQALDAAELPLVYIVTVNRSGRLRLARRAQQGTKLLREARFELGDILTPAPRAAPLIDSQHAPVLPAIVRTQPFPLLLPHPVSAERTWPGPGCHEWLVTFDRVEPLYGSVLCVTGDRRLTFWSGSRRGAKQICDTLPPGGLHWHDPGNADGPHSTAVVGQLAQGELSLLKAEPRNGKCELIPLALRHKDPRGVAAHLGALFVIFDEHVEVFSQTTGELLETLGVGEKCWSRDRFFFRHGDWLALSFDGRAARFVTVCHDPECELIGLFDCLGIDGPVGITRSAELRFFYDQEPAVAPAEPGAARLPIVQPRLPVSDEYRLTAVAGDGHRLVLKDGRSGTSSLADLRNGAVTQVRGDPRAALATHLVATINSYTLRKKFCSVGADGDGLVLVPSHGGAPLRLTCVADFGELRLVPASTDGPTLISFAEAPAPPGVGYRLAIARWKDGSRAFLDSRGLLHLKSSVPSIPELTLVLFEKYVPGWCSDGRVWGTEYFTGDAVRTNPRAIYEEVLKPFLSYLTC